MKKYKTYKFRLYPTKIQSNELNFYFGCARFVYNYFLSLNKDLYKKNYVIPTFYQNSKLLTNLKSQKQYHWLRRAPSQSMQLVLRNLSGSITQKNIYSKKFKSKRKAQSIFFSQNVKINENDKITFFPKIGAIKTVFHRPIEGEIKQTIITKTKNDWFYVLFQAEVNLTNMSKFSLNFYKKKKFIRFQEFAEFPSLPISIKLSDKKIAFLKNKMKSKIKYSNNWKRLERKLIENNEKKTRQMNDFFHQYSTHLTKTYRVIVIKSLPPGWHYFSELLKYKAISYRSHVVIENQFCSSCSKNEMSLSKNLFSYTCQYCNNYNHANPLKSVKLFSQKLPKGLRPAGLFLSKKLVQYLESLKSNFD